LYLFTVVVGNDYDDVIYIFFFLAFNLRWYCLCNARTKSGGVWGMRVLLSFNLSVWFGFVHFAVGELLLLC